MSRAQQTLDAAARIFSDDKVVHSVLLNRLGAQVVRTVAARMLDTVRGDGDASCRSQVAELRRAGLLICPDFLSSLHFDGIVHECQQLESHREHWTASTWGPNRLEVVRLRMLPPELVPCMRAFFEDPRLAAILGGQLQPSGIAAAARLERLINGEAGPGTSEDPQTRLHSDIFYSSHKAWLYLDDVGSDDGPLVYVKGSHRLSLERLSYIYRASCRRDPLADPSRRISDEELQHSRLSETALTVKRNTLVVVNVAGFHRRLQGRAGHRREALSVSVRSDPFKMS